MMGLKVVSVLSLCLALASCKVMNLEINAETELCSSTQAVTKDKEVTVMAKGSIPMTECTIKFDTNDQTKECGICFQFENYAYFNTTEASIVLTSGPMSKVIDATGDFPSMYMCSDETSLSLTLDHTVRYVYDPKEPGYNFILDVYNKCGYRGTAKSVPFSEVVKHAKGYHHGEEKEDREISSLVTGLVVGLCLASMFLIVLLIAYCYVKNSPNRGASKSAVSGKRTMDPSAPRSAPKSDVEMVAYKKEGDRPEGKPLLTGAAAAVVIATEDKKTKKRDRKNSNSSGSSSSNSSHGNDDVQADEKKGLIEPTVTITSEPSAPSESHTTSAGGGDSGVGGGSSDYTSGGGGSSDHTSSYGGGGGFSDYSSGGGGGGGGSCGGGGGGGGSCGGGGGSDD